MLMPPSFLCSTELLVGLLRRKLLHDFARRLLAWIIGDVVDPIEVEARQEIMSLDRLRMFRALRQLQFLPGAPIKIIQIVRKRRFRS